MSLLDVQISFFESVQKPDQPETVNLLEWLQDDSYKETIQQLRQTTGSEYQRQKKRLPGITPSGIFHTRSEAGLIEHSGLIQFDIDNKDNPGDMEALKEKIKLIPYVAYLEYSSSGNGLWGLIPIENPDQHKAHFRAIEQAFHKAGITIDPNPSNVASFRFVSWDPDPYVNHNAETFPHMIEPSKSSTRVPEGLSDTQSKVESLVDQIQSHKIDITEGYENWLRIAFALADEFGKSGRDYFHAVSRYHPDYDPKETDQQYTNCLKAGGQGVTIATFMHVCREYGIELKTGDPNHAPQTESRFKGDSEGENIAPYGFNPITGEIFDKRGYPSGWGDIEQPETGTPEDVESARYAIKDATPEELESLKSKDPTIRMLINLFDGQITTATDMMYTNNN